MEDPDLEGRAGGGGLDLLALLAFFPLLSFLLFLPKIRGTGPPWAPLLDSALGLWQLHNTHWVVSV